MQGNQLTTKECYLVMLAMDENVQTMNIEERRVTAKPTEVLKDVILDENNLEKYTKVGASMEKKTRQDLVLFLKESTDVFAWSHENMSSIDPQVSLPNV